jgi:hypothetical protein
MCDILEMLIMTGANGRLGRVLAKTLAEAMQRKGRRAHAEHLHSDYKKIIPRPVPPSRSPSASPTPSSEYRRVIRRSSGNRPSR